MQKPVIAIDIDNVLAAHAGALISVYNNLYDTAYQATDYDENWAWIEDDEKVREFRQAILNSGVHRGMNIVTGAYDSIKLLHVKYDLVIITARWPEVSEITNAWLDDNFQGLFKGIHLSGVFTGKDGEVKKTKADICLEIGAEYLIDDNIGHCKIAAEAGITAILFGNYTWNQSDALPAKVVRCKDWREVAEYFGVKQ